MDAHQVCVVCLFQVRLIAPAREASPHPGVNAEPVDSDAGGEAASSLEQPQQKTVLCVHIEQAMVRDTTADAAAVNTGESAAGKPGAGKAAPKAEAAFDATTSASSTKEVRVRGYEVSLEYAEEDSDGLRVARKVPVVFTATPDLWDLITITLHHAGPPHVPKVDAKLFLHSFAAAVSPELARDLNHLIACFTGAALVRRMGGDRNWGLSGRLAQWMGPCMRRPAFTCPALLLRVLLCSRFLSFSFFFPSLLLFVSSLILFRSSLPLTPFFFLSYFAPISSSPLHTGSDSNAEPKAASHADVSAATSSSDSQEKLWKVRGPRPARSPRHAAASLTPCPPQLQVSATVVRSDVMVAYEDLPLDDAHVLAWLECRNEYQAYFQNAQLLEESLLSSSVIAVG